MKAGKWLEPDGAEQRIPTKYGAVEAWGRPESNPVNGRIGLNKSLRGRFAVFVSPLTEKVDQCALVRNTEKSRVRANRAKWHLASNDGRHQR